MSSEKFENHEDEYCTYYKDLKIIIKDKLPRLSGEQRKRELRNADRLFEDAEAQLTQMFEEAQTAPGPYRSSLMSKTRGFKNEFEKLKRELNAAKSSASSQSGNREDLLGGGASNDFENRQRSLMQEGLDILNRGSESVARSQRIAAETDEYGVQIIADLDDQRESLIRANDKLKQTDADLGRSRRLINSIGVRVMTNKLLLIVIIVVELVILGAIIYLRFGRRK